MNRNIEFDLAELVSRHVPTGTVVLRVPRILANRLVEDLEILDASIQTAEDVGSIPPTEWNGLTVTYKLDDTLGRGHVQIEQQGVPGARIPLPMTLHV